MLKIGYCSKVIFLFFFFVGRGCIFIQKVLYIVLIYIMIHGNGVPQTPLGVCVHVLHTFEILASSASMVIRLIFCSKSLKKRKNNYYLATLFSYSFSCWILLVYDVCLDAQNIPTSLHMELTVRPQSQMHQSPCGVVWSYGVPLSATSGKNRRVFPQICATVTVHTVCLRGPYGSAIKS